MLSSINPDGWSLWAGAENPAAAPFRVSNAGEVWLENAHINADMQSGNYAAGSQGWKIDQSGKAEFNDVTIRGAFQATVFSQATTSVMASRTIITDGGALISDVGISDAFIDIDTPVFSNLDYVNLAASATRKEWMLITSGPMPVPGGYRYTVNRGIDGSAPSNFFAGEVVFSKGSSTYPETSSAMGEFVELGSYQAGILPISVSSFGGFLTLEGSREWGPYFGVAKRFGPAFNQISDILRIGRLDGFWGVEGNKYGFATGDVNRRMIYTNDDGLSIVTANGDTRIDDTGITTRALGILPANSPSYRTGVGVLFVDEAAMKVKIRFKSSSTYAEKEALVADLSGAGAVVEAWPVGSVFIAVVPTNPSALLGYGTWVEFATGRTLVGIDAAQTEFNTAGGMGGEKAHVLTTSEMPSHTHIQDSHNHL